MDDSSTEAPLELTAFQASVERCIGMLSGRVKHCGRSSHRHLRRAWMLRRSAPELAAFCMITAEEEAATAVILALKSNQYSGSEKLNHKSHPHKLSLTPFLRAISDVLEHLDYAMPEIHIQEGKNEYKVVLRLDANKLVSVVGDAPRFVEPVPALNFAISDQNGPLDFAAKFSEFAEFKGRRNVTEFINSEANFRNKLLYAHDDGIAHVEFPTGFFEKRIQRVTNLFVVTLLIAQSSEEQLFVTQCLDALLQIHKKIDATQFEFEPRNDGPLLSVERAIPGTQYLTRPPHSRAPPPPGSTSAAPARYPSMTPVSLIGSAAALCTTGAYIPQLVKTWRSRRAADISGHMFALLMLGTALWLAYGILKTDWAIIVANAVSLALASAVMALKLHHG